MPREAGNNSKSRPHSIQRNVYFAVFCAITLAIFYTQLKFLAQSSLNNELYSHMIFIPIISGYIIYSNRRAIFQVAEYSLRAVGTLAICWIILYLLSILLQSSLTPNDHLSLTTLSALVLWVGGVVMFYGSGTLGNARVPIPFPVFIIPISRIAGRISVPDRRTKGSGHNANDRCVSWRRYSAPATDQYSKTRSQASSSCQMNPQYRRAPIHRS